MAMRLQKILSAAGVLSRRKAEEAIKGGRVSVNGQVITHLGSQANPLEDRVELDGRLIEVPKEKTTLLLHKPNGYLTTKGRQDERKIVMDLLPKEFQNLNPIGRLDYQTEGLLLLTNDGDLSQRIAHPSFSVERTYVAEVAEGVPAASTLKVLTTLVELDDGPGRFKTVTVIDNDPPTLKIVCTEGRNRFVRRMCQSVGHKVRRLIRTKFGPLSLEDLKMGEYRQVETLELESLWDKK